MSDVEVRETEIFDWRKKVTEAECKLKQQENLLESLVSERNLYSKNLIEAQVRRSQEGHSFINGVGGSIPGSSCPPAEVCITS